MSFGLKLALKIIGFCFLIIVLQTSLINSFWGFNINLPFIVVIAFASLLGVYENVIAGLFFCSIISLLSYDNHLPWIYLVLGIIANRLNPENIADKLLICIIFCLILTPLMELFNPNSSRYLYRILSSSLINVVTVIPMYFIVNFVFSKTNTLKFSYE